MKLWAIAGVLTVAWTPISAAAETTRHCEAQDECSLRAQTIVAPAPAGGSRQEAPAREAGGARARQAEAATAARTARADLARRRGGSRRIPDAELIGGRGAL